MRSTDEAAVSSVLLDVREVPLVEIPALTPVTLDKTLQRVLDHPGSLTAPVPVAAFSSAI
jgi:hypothetical protein